MLPRETALNQAGPGRVVVLRISRERVRPKKRTATVWEDGSRSNEVAGVSALASYRSESGKAESEQKGGSWLGYGGAKALSSNPGASGSSGPFTNFAAA
jgi:hypothetical protein